MPSPCKLAALVFLPLFIPPAASSSARALRAGQEAQKAAPASEESSKKTTTITSTPSQEGAGGGRKGQEVTTSKETITSAAAAAEFAGKVVSSKETTVEGSVVRPAVAEGGADASPLAACVGTAAAAVNTPGATVSGPANPFMQVAVAYKFTYTLNCSAGTTTSCPFCYDYLIERQTPTGWDFVTESKTGIAVGCGGSSTVTVTENRSEFPGTYRITLKVWETCMDPQTTYATTTHIFTVTTTP